MKYLILLVLSLVLISCNDSDDAITPVAPPKAPTDKAKKPSNDNNTADDNTTTDRVDRSYHRDASTRAVTNEYGQLVVTEGEASYYDSTVTPWSSWWFPAREKFLFYNRGGLSPLEKYDRYMMKRHDMYSEAAIFEEKEIYNPMTASWAGLCHAWAVAAVTHKEPTMPRSIEGIQFSVADQKALLLKSYENVSELKIYGERFDGNYEDDYEDVYADQFHRFIQVFLGDKKLPFLMDYDASYPVWTVPVYKAKARIEREADDSVLVKTWLTIASPFVPTPMYVGTKSVVKTYEYRLYGKWEGDSFVVDDGEWLNESVVDHPDYLATYPINVVRGTLNKELSFTYIDEILGTTLLENIEGLNHGNF